LIAEQIPLKLKSVLSPARYADCIPTSDRKMTEYSKLSYKHGDVSLVLEPLKSQIDTSASDFTVGKVKVEIRLAKTSSFRWGNLVGDVPDGTFFSLVSSNSFHGLTCSSTFKRTNSRSQSRRHNIDQAKEELGWHYHRDSRLGEGKVYGRGP
jgi:hypothetical protein